MNEYGVSKLRGVWHRRKVPMLLAAVATLGVGVALSLQVEAGYKAQAVIRADEAQPSKEYVAPTVTEQIGDRLRSLRLSVMARPVVLDAARALGLDKLYPDDAKFQQAVDRMRAKMDVKVEGQDTFLLTFSDPSPDRAQAMVNKMADVFMRRQVEQRHKIATATTQALRAETDALQPQMAAAEKALRDYKLAHYGALPEQLESNLRALDTATMEINIQSTNLDTDLERRRQLLAAALSPLRHQEEALASQLYEARIHYTDDNAEVRRIRAQYEKVRGERQADEKDLYAKTRRNNPELIGLENEISRTRAMIDGLRGRRTEVQRRVEATARNGQELAGLQITFDALKDKLNMTRSHLHDAELAERLEGGLANLRFELVEGATTPAATAFPNPTVLTAATVLLALALGLGLGFALDALDTTVRDGGSLVGHTDLPVLGAIPHAPLFSTRPSNKPTAEA